MEHLACLHQMKRKLYSESRQNSLLPKKKFCSFVSAYLTIFHFAYDAVRILKTEAYIPRIEYEKGLAEFPQALPVADQIDITSLWFGIRGDPYENRTRVSAVKGRCLNRLTNGPLW